jgi:Putative prokaryotic signal transducing protein
MQANPLEEWQRLSELYREKSEEELRELADDFADLTETAQQVLRDEMNKRGMGDPDAQKNMDRPGAESNPPATVHWEPQSLQDDLEADQENTDQPHEYTWKTPLCECDDKVEAWQLSEALRRAGIESWIEQEGSSRYSFGISNPRILVAADQLDQARAIAAQPIPQEIIDQSKVDPPAYEPPACPQCGAKDPVLETVDPTNSWQCEACGKQWTETADALNQTPEAANP